MCFGNWKTIFQWIYQKDSTHQCFCNSPQHCAQKKFFEQFFEKFFYFRVRRGMGDYSGFLQWLSLTSLSTNKIKKSLKLAFEVNTFKNCTFFQILGHCASVLTWYQSTFSHVFQFSLLSCNLSGITIQIALQKFNNFQKIHLSASKNKRLFFIVFMIPIF